MAPVLELRHITCGYDPEEPPALRDVSLALEPGERLALVRRCSRGYMVKKHGATGWDFGRVEENIEPLNGSAGSAT